MSARFYPDAEVATWQPRTRHYYHGAGRWSAAGYMAWVEERIAVWCEQTGVERRRLGDEQHAAFTAWLGRNCACGGER